MHREDLLVDDGSDWQAVEAVCECLPQLDVVPSLAFVVESIDSIDRCALVVSAQDEEVLGVFDLVRKQQADGLQALLASINVIAQEEVVCLWRKPPILKETQQVVVLAMYITAYLYNMSINDLRTGNDLKRRLPLSVPPAPVG